MTTRRGFLGLMAASPVAAAFAARQAAGGGEVIHTGTFGYIGESASEAIIPLRSLRTMSFVNSGLMVDRGVLAAPSDELGGFVIPETLRPEVKLRLSPVPNRLYGAYINEDGDAV